MNCAGEGLVFFRSITVLPVLSLAGPEYVIDAAENRQHLTANRYAVDFFYNLRPRVINPVAQDVYIGLTTIPEPYQGFTFYQPSVQFDHNSIIPPGMLTKQLKPHKYGVFTYMSLHRPEEISAHTLQDIWEYIRETWMPTVQFDLEETFHFEWVNYAKCNKHYCECDLYYPISGL